MSTLKVNNVTDLGDDAIVTDGALVGAGKILQVVSTTFTSPVSINSGSFQDVTGLSVSITPSATSSKVMVIANVKFSTSGSNSTLQLVRQSTPVGNGASGFAQTNEASPLNFVIFNASIGFLDSPNTTSATTYKIQARGTPVVINRRGADTVFEVSSDITVMEVAG